MNPSVEISKINTNLSYAEFRDQVKTSLTALLETHIPETRTTATFTQPEVDTTVLMYMEATNWLGIGSHFTLVDDSLGMRGAYEVMEIQTDTRILAKLIAWEGNISPGSLIASDQKVILGSPNSEVAGSVTSTTGFAWNRDTDGDWSPVSNNTQVTATFKRGGATIGTRTIQVNRDADGLLSTNPYVGTEDGITISRIGDDTKALTLIFTHSTGASAYAVFIATMDGAQGSTGPQGPAGAPGNDAGAGFFYGTWTDKVQYPAKPGMLAVVESNGMLFRAKEKVRIIGTVANVTAIGNFLLTWEVWNTLKVGDVINVESPEGDQYEYDGGGWWIVTGDPLTDVTSLAPPALPGENDDWIYIGQAPSAYLQKGWFSGPALVGADVNSRINLEALQYHEIAAPVFSHGSGNYDGDQKVAIFGRGITRFTTNDTDVLETSAVYNPNLLLHSENLAGAGWARSAEITVNSDEGLPYDNIVSLYTPLVDRLQLTAGEPYFYQDVDAADLPNIIGESAVFTAAIMVRADVACRVRGYIYEYEGGVDLDSASFEDTPVNNEWRLCRVSHKTKKETVSRLRVQWRIIDSDDPDVACSINSYPAVANKLGDITALTDNLADPTTNNGKWFYVDGVTGTMSGTYSTGLEVVDKSYVQSDGTNWVPKTPPFVDITRATLVRGNHPPLYVVNDVEVARQDAAYSANGPLLTTSGPTNIRARTWIPTVVPSPQSHVALNVIGGGTVDVPTCNQQAGIKYYPFYVKLATTTSGASIYYTLDGTDPKTSGTRLLYSSPVYIEGEEEDIPLRAVAFKSGTYSGELARSFYFVTLNDSWTDRYGLGSAYEIERFGEVKKDED
jgi:hypothetical protein